MSTPYIPEDVWTERDDLMAEQAMNEDEPLMPLWYDIICVVTLIAAAFWMGWIILSPFNT